MLASIHTHSSAQCSRVCLESCSSFWEGRMWRSLVICEVQHSSKGVFRLALCGEKGCSRTLCSHYIAFSLLQPVAPFVQIPGHGNAEKGPRLARTCSAKKKEEFNPLILTPLLPSLSPFPHEHTRLVQMYPNRRGIQKGMWFKKERKKVSIFFLSCKSFFFSFFSYIGFFYESY